MFEYQLDPPVVKEFIPLCPVCGAECDTLYEDKFRDIAGCDRCIHLLDAYEVLYEDEFC